MDRPGNVIDRPLTGTPHYLPPELVSSKIRADQRSDVYSLGVTLYWSLTGRLPFTADTVAELVRAHREITVPDPRRVRPQLPRNVSRYVLQMMSKQPLRRPQTAQEVAERLMDFEIETFEERSAA
jgi:serine/threonine-protein kinase